MISPGGVRFAYSKVARPRTIADRYGPPRCLLKAFTQVGPSHLYSGHLATIAASLRVDDFRSPCLLQVQDQPDQRGDTVDICLLKDTRATLFGRLWANAAIHPGP